MPHFMIRRDSGYFGLSDYLFAAQFHVKLRSRCIHHPALQSTVSREAAPGGQRSVNVHEDKERQGIPTPQD